MPPPVPAPAPVPAPEEIEIPVGDLRTTDGTHTCREHDDPSKKGKYMLCTPGITIESQKNHIPISFPVLAVDV